MAGVIVAIAATMPASTGSAQTDGTLYSAVGGGQYRLFFGPGPELGEGQGSTIAFSARQLVSGSIEAEGELEDVDRSRDGRSPVFHGSAICMAVSPDERSAIIDYRSRRDDPDGPFVRLYVEDNGNGPSDDVILLQRHLQGGPQCVADPGLTVGGALVRGNVQIEAIG